MEVMQDRISSSYFDQRPTEQRPMTNDELHELVQMTVPIRDPETGELYGIGNPAPGSVLASQGWKDFKEDPLWGTVGRMTWPIAPIIFFDDMGNDADNGDYLSALANGALGALSIAPSGSIASGGIKALAKPAMQVANGIKSAGGVGKALKYIGETSKPWVKKLAKPVAKKFGSILNSPAVNGTNNSDIVNSTMQTQPTKPAMYSAFSDLTQPQPEQQDQQRWQRERLKTSGFRPEMM